MANLIALLSILPVSKESISSPDGLWHRLVPWKSTVRAVIVVGSVLQHMTAEGRAYCGELSEVEEKHAVSEEANLQLPALRINYVACNIVRLT